MAKCVTQYQIETQNTIGSTPKGVNYLLDCIKAGWAVHPELSAMGEKSLINNISPLCFGINTTTSAVAQTNIDPDLGIVNGDNKIVHGLTAARNSNAMPGSATNIPYEPKINYTYKDLACYVSPSNLIKLGDLKDTYYIRDDLVYVSQYSEMPVSIKPTYIPDQAVGNTIPSAISAGSCSLCAPTVLDRYTYTFSDTNTGMTLGSGYDDWVAVSAAQFYGRENAEAGARVTTSNVPYVDIALNGLHTLAFSKQEIKKQHGIQTIRENLYYTSSGVLNSQGAALQHVCLPNFIINNSPINTVPGDYSTTSPNINFQHNTSSIPRYLGIFSNVYAWGKFNVCTALHDAPTTDFKMYPKDLIIGSRNLNEQISVMLNIDMSKTSPDPAEYYGGKTVWVIKKTDYKNSGSYQVPDVDPEINTLSRYPAFSVDGGIENFYSDFSKLRKSPDKHFEPIIIFPDEDKLQAFLADWGIVYCTNLDDAKNLPNPNINNPDFPPDDPWSGDPTDPNAPPNDPWENPTTPTDPVNPDPDTPGDDPAPDAEDIPDINLTGNCYLLSRLTMDEVEKWLLGENFLNDSSNLFTDKLSAINAATVFPFDLSVHDPNHTTAVSAINIAGASKTLNGVKSISAAYNNCIDGGTLTYSDDWTAATPSYNAFLNANYTVNIPCLGAVQVPPSSVIGRKLILKYYIDIISGAATAVLYSYPTESFTNGFADNGFIVFSGGCQLGQPVPIYSSNYTQRQLAIASSTISALFAPITGGNISQNIPKMGQNATTIPTSAASSAASSAALSAAGGAGIAVSALNYIRNVASAGFNAAVSNPLEFGIKGSYGAGNAWSMGLRASLTVTYQIPAKPNNYNYVMGQTSSYRGTLKKFSGANINSSKSSLNYVECAATILNVNGATETELEMIQSALSSGVFV